MFRLLLSHREALEKYFEKRKYAAMHVISLERGGLSFVSVTSHNVLQKVLHYDGCNFLKLIFKNRASYI
jgi:hypothetical protein